MFERFDFPDRIAAAKALAESVAGEIEIALQNAGVAAIAVSGGTTPARFFAELGKRRDLDWKKVYVTLVDERWVEETSNRSNAGLVNETMLQGPAASLRAVGGRGSFDQPFLSLSAFFSRSSSPPHMKNACSGTWS